MTTMQSFDRAATENIGQEIHDFIAQLYPICRSITGNGDRDTFVRIGSRIPRACHEVPTDTQIFEMCEPKLGSRGLYRMVGGQADEPVNELAVLWVLNLSDGPYSLLDITERSGLPFAEVKRAADALRDHELLTGISEHGADNPYTTHSAAQRS